MDHRSPSEIDQDLAFADAIERVIDYRRQLLIALEDAEELASSERFDDHLEDVRALHTRVIAATISVTALRGAVIGMFSSRLRGRQSVACRGDRRS